MRLTLASLKQRNASCQLRPLQLLEINLFQESDHFHGLLTLFKVEDLTSGKELTLEAHMHPKHYYSVIDAKGPVGRLQYLEVNLCCSLTFVKFECTTFNVKFLF